MSDFRKTTVHISARAIVVQAYSYEFVPLFLWYMFEAKGIPRDRPIMFDDGIYEFSEDHQELKEVS